MTLQKPTDLTIPEPTAEVLATIRRRVQHACDHTEFRIVDGDARRTECLNCGYRMSMRRARRRTR